MFTSDDIVVTALPGENYPVQVELFLPQPESETTPTLYTEFGLTVAEAKGLIDQLTSAVSEIEDRSFVQIEMGPYGSVHTYADPTGELQPGDRVTVSGAASQHVGKVIARGRGVYQGPVYERVTGKVVLIS